MIDDNQQQEQCPLCHLTFSRRNFGSHIIFCQDRYERQMKAESLKSHEEHNSNLNTFDRLDKGKLKNLTKSDATTIKRRDKASQMKKRKAGKYPKKFEDSFIVDESSESSGDEDKKNNKKNNQSLNRRIQGKENDIRLSNNNGTVNIMNNNVNISNTSADKNDFMKQKNTRISNSRQDSHCDDTIRTNINSDDSHFRRNVADKSNLNYIHHQLNNNDNYNKNKNRVNICKSSNNLVHQIENGNHSTAGTNSNLDISHKKEENYSQIEKEGREEREKKMKFEAFQEIVFLTKNILNSSSPKNIKKKYETYRKSSENIENNKNKIFRRKNVLFQDRKSVV